MPKVDGNALVELSASIVSAYVQKNPLTTTELTTLLKDVHATLRALRFHETELKSNKPSPAVSIRQSVKPDYLVCLEDGLKFTSMKRHLRAAHDMSPDEYRVRWGLPKDYPMSAPNYIKRRSELAKQFGLGRKPGET